MTTPPVGRCPAALPLRAIHDVPAPAKLNLFLHVVGRRADGYHLLQSVFVLLDWCDTLHFETRADGRLSRHDLNRLAPALPDDDLCLRAARALQQASGCPHGVDISIDKQLPSGAGLGGGSSDAASTLLALNRLWGLRWPLHRLLPIGLALGADVPFFLGGRNAWVEGIGERLTPVHVTCQWFAVVKPAASIDTRSLFAQRPAAGHSELAILEGFRKSAQGLGNDADSDAGLNRELSSGFGRNDLQPAAQAICGDVGRVADWLALHFGNSRMTGSGSAVFARAGSGGQPAEPMPDAGVMGLGWQGRMCRSLAQHPLLDW